MKKINFDLVFKTLVLFFLCVILIFLMSEHNYNSDRYLSLGDEINKIENEISNKGSIGRYKELENGNILDTQTGEVKTQYQSQK